jgi:crotonobetainyl-CoA:carnitine CoA-transferase CaiB-like acyl-CoA transferase
MTRPLAGVRVLDFGLLTAGANTSAMLADLGADVIKIESGAYLDPFRVVGKPDNEDGWWNRSPQFRFTNRNKRGLALNLKDPEGQRVIRDLAKHCDVVVENFRRGVLDRAGLGYANLKACNPGIVFAAISSQGDTGPERMNVSFGSTLDATSGIASLTGYEGEEPRISGMDVNYPDQIVSLFATGIVIAAVMEARRSGTGAFLDFSQREVASFTLGEEILAASADPTRPARQQRRRRGPAGCLPLQGRALDRRHAQCGRSVARLVLCRPRQQGRRGGAARPRARRRTLQRWRRPAARRQPRRRQPGARRAWRAGQGPALPARRPRHHHRARRARSRPAHRRSAA